jgi:hypothetical protein
MKYCNHCSDQRASAWPGTFFIQKRCPAAGPHDRLHATSSSALRGGYAPYIWTLPKQARSRKLFTEKWFWMMPHAPSRAVGNNCPCCNSQRQVLPLIDDVEELHEGSSRHVNTGERRKLWRTGLFQKRLPCIRCYKTIYCTK